MTYTFCPVCGNKLQPKSAGDDGNVPFCPNCQKLWFPTFSDCVIVLIANTNNEILLAKMPYLSKKYSSLISGYMQVGETTEMAVRREIKEEVGIDQLSNLHSVGSYWFNKTEALMHGFICSVSNPKIKLSTELESAIWTPLEQVPEKFFPDSPDNAAFAIYRKFLEEIKA